MAIAIDITKGRGLVTKALLTTVEKAIFVLHFAVKTF